MKITKIYSLIITLIICSFSNLGLAQIAAGEGEFKKSRNISFGFTVKENGYGLHISHQLPIKWKAWSPSLSFDLLTLKNDKEVKSINTNLPKSSAFVFGKQNRVGTGSINFGLSKPLLQRPNNKGIGARIGGNIGVAGAALRPVYLNIAVLNNKDNQLYIIESLYDPVTHPSTENIVGYAKENHSWSELDFAFNLQAKIYVTILWGNQKIITNGVQLGLINNYFPNRIPIMANTVNPKLYTVGYFTFFWRINTSKTTSSTF